MPGNALVLRNALLVRNALLLARGPLLLRSALRLRAAWQCQRGLLLSSLLLSFGVRLGEVGPVQLADRQDREAQLPQPPLTPAPGT